jgi:hypothetical protein
MTCCTTVPLTSLYLDTDPGAHASGFMLVPAPGYIRILCKAHGLPQTLRSIVSQQATCIHRPECSCRFYRKLDLAQPLQTNSLFRDRIYKIDKIHYSFCWLES